MGKTVRGKAKVKAKVAAAKKKIARKVKGCAALAALLGLALAGCATSDANPASRVTSAKYGDIVVKIDDHSHGEIRLTIGDGALASADSAGSTETASPTQTPTNTTSVPIDVRYNDAISGATAASKGVLGSIGSGLDAVLGLMQSKGTGDVKVTKKDGTEATIHCEGGQCSDCSDGSCRD